MSVLDVTILTLVDNPRLQEELKSVFLKQVSNLGFSKEVWTIFPTDSL